MLVIERCTQLSSPRSWSLAGFRGEGYSKGRSKWVQALWFAALNLVFYRWWCPRRFRCTLLRWFGASVGTGVFIRHRVRVHWPWKLTLEDDVWIGEDVWILNLEPVKIGHDSCLSQGVMLCTGSHDATSPTFEYANAPITVGSSAWLAAQSLVLPGVTIGSGSVIAARALVIKDVPEGTTVFGKW